VDPIVRERLQDEFLRLQRQLGTTVLFVTHDIDEAIKMGDRVAVLEKGGVLAQYATPPELLMNPATDFVEDFVGADRALKRLSLLRVRDIDLWKAPLARVGEPTANVRAAISSADLPHPLVVDEDGRPLGWLSERDLAQQTVPARPDTSADPVVELDDVLRDALSDLLRSDTQYGPVVDQHGRVAGVLSAEIVSHFLSSDRAAEVATGAAERVTG
jgi:osmoprotectant transport system ATP-binding protein